MKSVDHRPLIVFTGQGIARADGFDLETELRSTDEGTEAFDLAGNAVTLDDVFSGYRAKRPAMFERLISTTRKCCRAAWKPGIHDENQRKMFSVLVMQARTRPVVHFTTNLDGISTRVAVEHGAPWGPRSGWYSVADILCDIGRILEARRGLAHVPLHGEAGLLAHPADEHAGAQRIWNAPKDFKGSAFSTLAEGVGLEVRNIESRTHLAKSGYRLLLSLLIGGSGDGSKRVAGGDSGAPADLLTVGYGAGAAIARESYPFEKKINLAWQEMRQLGRWCALEHAPSSREAVVTWYSQRGFRIERYEDGGLAEAVQKSLDGLG